MSLYGIVFDVGGDCGGGYGDGVVSFNTKLSTITWR